MASFPSSGNNNDNSVGNGGGEEVFPDLHMALEGGLLLKFPFAKHAVPAFRNFFVTSDFQYLRWVSKKKAQGDSQIQLAKCTLLEGQKTAVFSKHNRADLKNLSFSLQEGSKTVDIACKDAKEYNVWVSALKHIIDHGPPPAKQFKEWRASHAKKGSAASRSSTRLERRKTMTQEAGSEFGKKAKVGLRDRMKDANDCYVWGFNSGGS